MFFFLLGVRWEAIGGHKAATEEIFYSEKDLLGCWVENGLWTGGLWERSELETCCIHLARGAGGLDQGDVEEVLRNGRILDKF